MGICEGESYVYINRRQKKNITQRIRNVCASMTLEMLSR